MKMAPACALVRRACSCVILLRRFSTASATDYAARAISAVERPFSPQSYRAPPLPSLPVPDGFPFSIHNVCGDLEFTREDKDESTSIYLRLMNTCHLANNASPCFPDTKISVRRGHWYMRLTALIGPEALRIQEAYMSEEPKGNLKGFGDILDSKGIDAIKIANLFKKHVLQNKSIDA